MGIFTGLPRGKRPTILSMVKSSLIYGRALKSFFGCRISDNKLNQSYGQLQRNKNMEYVYSGSNVFLRTKRGSSLILDITNRPYGAALYQYNRVDEFLIWIDGTAVKYCGTDGSGSGSLAAGLTSNKQTFFQMYGQDTASALYGCNGTDIVFKISGATPTYSAIALSPVIDYIAFGTLVGRMFGAKGHTVYYSKVQTGTGVANLEDWDVGTNTAIVSPDKGTGISAILDYGSNGIYFFKDTGVWVLANAREATADWNFPQCNSDVGTPAPKTVKAVNYNNSSAMMFLGSDKTLRVMAPTIEYNAGKLPTVVNSSSMVISEDFKQLLLDIPDGYIDKCTATYFGRYYILNYVSSAGTDIDSTIVIDLAKLLPAQGSNIAQPYWFESELMDYCEFVIRPFVSKLYGFNINGYISQLFVDGLYYEEIPTRITLATDHEYEDVVSVRHAAIRYEAYLVWFDFSESYSGRLLELIKGYLHWEASGSWGLNFVINSFMRGDPIPNYDEGIETTLSANTQNGYFDISTFDESLFSGNSLAMSTVTSTKSKGHYFLFGIYNNNLSEPVSVYGFNPIFKLASMDPLGRR